MASRSRGTAQGGAGGASGAPNPRGPGPGAEGIGATTRARTKNASDAEERSGVGDEEAGNDDAGSDRERQPPSSVLSTPPQSSAHNPPSEPVNDETSRRPSPEDDKPQRQRGKTDADASGPPQGQPTPRENDSVDVDDARDRSRSQTEIPASQGSNAGSQMTDEECFKELKRLVSAARRIWKDTDDIAVELAVQFKGWSQYNDERRTAVERKCIEMREVIEQFEHTVETGDRYRLKKRIFPSEDGEDDNEGAQSGGKDKGKNKAPEPQGSSQ